MNSERAKEIVYFLFRIVSGLMIFQPGAMKILGWYGGMPAGAVLDTQTRIGGWIELVGGVLIMLGLFTRPAAFILSGTMAVAYFQFHQPNGAWPVQNGGQPAVHLCFMFLLIVAYGAGIWSVDRVLGKRRKDNIEL